MGKPIRNKKEIPCQGEVTKTGGFYEHFTKDEALKIYYIFHINYIIIL